MRKLLITAAVVLFCMCGTFAQDYKSSVGLRGGYATGITIKHFLNETSAIEGIATLRWGGFNLTGLYEMHKGPLADVEFLNWYFGGGAHFGSWKEYSWYSERDLVIGLDGIIGVEYTLTDFDLPFNVSLDYKPALNLVGYSAFTGDEFALSVRYIF